ncbi:hypothetical protein [Mycobacterium sp. 29Ha]|uniref:hypothetical protein n=1 Tax=Mycobacterium sp. 29Ha TaxID=2939268 RepID=UPI0029394DB8|nr:hypothetical protein [Mycobacterium sp. 29Ha]MDV3135724.1 hypothetical protein [Mycobacterium sp. 29Ha]
MEQTTTERLHIVEGTDWKDAAIALMESRCPYRPWRYGFGEMREGDPVAVVLNTDPPSIMTTLGRIGIDGRSDRAVIEWPYPGPTLLDLTTLTAVVNFPHDQDPRNVWMLRGDAAIRLELALRETEWRNDQSMRFGHSSVVAARILLHSEGRCTGCDSGIDLTWWDARDHAHIRTVDAPLRDPSEVLIQDKKGWASYVEGPFNPKSWLLPELPTDWPGVLCPRCVTRMDEDGHATLLDFRFSQHPKCPNCGAGRTQRALFGMPARLDNPPWLDMRGCCVTPDNWTCTACAYKW